MNRELKVLIIINTIRYHTHNFYRYISENRWFKFYELIIILLLITHEPKKTFILIYLRKYIKCRNLGQILEVTDYKNYNLSYFEVKEFL